MKIYVFCLLLILSFTSVEAKTFTISPGNDTLPQAQREVRNFRASQEFQANPQPVRVVLQAGEYVLTEPLVFTSEDSGTENAPIFWEAADGAKVVISGGYELEKSWKNEGNGVFSVDCGLPEETGTQLFLTLPDGTTRRAVRARTPNVDSENAANSYFYARKIETAGNALAGASCDGLRVLPRDVPALRELLADSCADVLLYQCWSTSHNRVRKFDPELGKIEFTRPLGRFFHGRLNRFYVENSRAALDVPGEWFFDRKLHRVFYIPRMDEDLQKVCVRISACPRSLFRISGDFQNRKPAAFLTFRGLTFSFTDADLSPDYAHSVQGADTQEGAFHAVGLTDSVVENCTFAHLGENGLNLMEGCRRNVVRDCRFEDLGAGGVYFSAKPEGSPEESALTCENVVENNLIHDGGKIYHAACGVFFAGMASNNRVAHNEICNFRWTGIHLGWSWSSTAKSWTTHNDIAYNHVHHIGNGTLTDLAGIYMLGVSTGTRVHHNFFHDITRYDYNGTGYGGWGIYFDAGSSEITIEKNVVVRTRDGGLHLHNYDFPYGDVVENNIFGFCPDGSLMRNANHNTEKHPFHARLERNIVFNAGPSLFTGAAWGKGQKVILNRNCYWTYDTNAPDFHGLTFEKWQAETGQDAQSVTADPQFVDVRKDDFRLKPTSPALALGFEEFDYQNAGIEAGHPLFEAAKTVPAARPEIYKTSLEGLNYAEDFESYAPGEVPDLLVPYPGGDGAKVEVSTEQAVKPGAKALKLQDAPGLKNIHDPHVFLQQQFPAGPLACRFSIFLEESNQIQVEWREYVAGSYVTGPTFHIGSDGTVSVAGQFLTQIPLKTWVTLEIQCVNAVPVKDSDASKPRTWALRVGDQRFPNLPMSPKFRNLQWVGFISLANDRAVFYLDNLSVKGVH